MTTDTRIRFLAAGLTLLVLTAIKPAGLGSLPVLMFLFGVLLCGFAVFCSEEP